MKTISLVLMIPLLASACMWVKPDAAGEKVRVAYDGRVDGCTKLGEVTVGVRDKIALGVERNQIKVIDELESLARNEAATLGADTISALSEPRNGEQRFAAWRCKR